MGFYNIPIFAKLKPCGDYCSQFKKDFYGFLELMFVGGGMEVSKKCSKDVSQERTNVQVFCQENVSRFFGPELGY